MQTYFTNAQDLWERVQDIGGIMAKDFELTYYGEDTEEVSGYVIMYKGLNHDMYKINKTVEMLYNKLVNNGLKENVQLVKRPLNRPDKYNEVKNEYVIELYPGLRTRKK